MILSNCYVADSYTDLLMKMPSSTNIKVEAKSTTVLEDAGKQCLNCLEKKVRNLEKRKVSYILFKILIFCQWLYGVT